MKINFHIISLFPEVVKSYTDSSILGRAKEKGILNINFYNPKDFASVKGERIDDRPFGGGPGMVIQAMPVIKAWEKAKAGKKNVETFFFSPSGRLFTNGIAEELATSQDGKIKTKNIILICGRYEGIDARVIDITQAKLLSVGDFVLTGGEVPAMIVVDAVSRRLPGVLGKFESIEEKRVAGALVYTRPEVIKYKKSIYEVPPVLLSGHHQKIDEWKKSQNSSIKEGF